MLKFREEVNALPPYILGGKFSDELEKHKVTRVVKLNSNEPAYGPFPAAIKAMQEAIFNLHRLPEDGCPELRSKLSKKFSIPQENICVNAGSWEILRLLALACINRGDEVLMGWPTWPPVIRETQVMGAVCVQVPLDNHRIDLQAVLNKISPRTKIVYICSPNNPTGTVVSRSAFDAYFAAVPDHVVSVVDEAYFEYNRDPHTCSATTYLTSGKPLLVLNAEGSEPVNNLCVPSLVSPSYTLRGEHLVATTIIGTREESDEALEALVKIQLQGWFGSGVEKWRLIRVYRIPHALPVQAPPVSDPTDPFVQISPWLFTCGEYRNVASLQWAMVSGRRAAEAVIRVLQPL